MRWLTRVRVQAEACYSEALALGEGDRLSDSFHASMLCGRGEARESMGRSEEAFVDYTGALDKDKTLYRAARARGRLFVKRGEYSVRV